MTPIRHTANHANLPILRALQASGAFLFMPVDALEGGVFRPGGDRSPMKKVRAGELRMLEREGLVELTEKTSRSRRYRISKAGRAAVASSENRPRTAADRRNARWLEAEQLFQLDADAEPRMIRVNMGESPIGWLAKRRNANGRPFLAPAEVDAGERLRADFERAHLGPSVTQDWRKFLTAGVEGHGGEHGLDSGAEAARRRVGEALEALGPGLADAALRACCFLEGLEAVETAMDWSARSGKVVLKIALQRLADHYLMTAPPRASAPVEVWRAP